MQTIIMPMYLVYINARWCLDYNV